MSIKNGLELMDTFPTTRREFLSRASGGFGTLALAGLCSDLQAAPDNPLAPRNGHHAAKADRVIFLYSTGGTSHIDTFNHRPQLTADHGKSITASRWLNKSGDFKRFLIKPRWAFKQYGQSGTWVSDLFPHLGSVIDDVCVLNAMHCESDGHDKATLAAHTGSAQFARPSAGSWVSYGLGTVNQNLPSFMVLAPAAPYAGAQTWGCDFLPGCHQGTHVIPGKEPLPNIRPQVPDAALQQMELALLGRLNQVHLKQRAADQALDARIRSFETAFGMQREAPEAFDLSTETESTLNLYGIGRGATAGFGWQCLVARRLAERGVRFLELIDVGSSGNWDSHGNMGDHERLARAIDKPIAGLLTDLKQRGMLERNTRCLDDRIRSHSLPPESGSRWSGTPQPVLFVMDGRRRREGWHRSRPVRRIRNSDNRRRRSHSRLARHNAAPAGHRPRATHLPPRRS